MMLKPALYAYCVGAPPTLQDYPGYLDDVAFRWLETNNRPDFRTITAFHYKHLGDINLLFFQALLMCKQVGMVGVGAWPWTEPRSWAVLMGRNRIREKLFKQEKVLMAEVAFLFGRAEAIDKVEDDRFGAPRPRLWPRRGTGQGPARARVASEVSDPPVANGA